VKASDIVPVEADRLPRGLVSLYHRYAFTTIDTKAGYAYDSLDGWTTVSAHAMNVLRESIAPLRTSDPKLYLAESEWLEKMGVCWRARGLGAATKWEPQTTYDANQAAVIGRDLHDLGQELVGRLKTLTRAEAKRLHDDGTIPVAHGKGSPLWYNANDRHAAVCLAAISERCRNYDEFEYRMTHVAETRVPISLVSYIRLQAGRKPMPNYVIDVDHLVEKGTRLGPKVRTIQALPFGLNYLGAGAGNLIKWAMQSDPGMSGNITDALNISRTFGTILATDLATYDDTVSAESDAAWAYSIYEPCLKVCVQLGILTSARARLLMEIEERVRFMGLLCPPRRMGLGAELVPTAGRIKSGKRMTSIEGTTINRCRIRAKMRKHRIKGTSVNWGDDTVILTHEKMSQLKAFIEDTEFGGFKETPADDASFLMKRLPFGYGYLGRMMLGTIDREMNAEPDNMMTAALGIATRRAILQGHPLAHVYDDWLKTTPSRRLRLAHALALGADYRNLMRTVAALAESKGANWDAMMEVINRAEQAGLITPALAAEVRLIAEKVAIANEPPYGIFRADAVTMPLVAAERYLHAQAYTTQEQVRRAA
jgi:hypothetical protein